MKGIKFEADFPQITKKETIRSQDRLSGSSHDFVVQLSTSHNVDRIDLESITIPPLYNIDTNNNQFVLSGVTITIPSGGYSITQLMTAMQSLAQTAIPGPPWSFVYNVAAPFAIQTYKVTISRGPNFTLDFTLSDQAKRLAQMLGFNVALYSGTNTYTGQNVADVSIPAIYIQIDELGSYNQNTTHAQNVNNLRYSVSSTFSVTLAYDAIGQKNFLSQSTGLGEQKVILDNPKNLHTLHIRVLDDWGNIKNLQGAEWNMVLLKRWA